MTIWRQMPTSDKMQSVPVSQYGVAACTPPDTRNEHCTAYHGAHAAHRGTGGYFQVRHEFVFAYWMSERSRALARTRALDFRRGFWVLVQTYEQTCLNLNRWQGCLSLLGLRLRHCDENSKLVDVRKAQEILHVKSEHLRILIRVMISMARRGRQLIDIHSKLNIYSNSNS